MSTPQSAARQVNSTRRLATEISDTVVLAADRTLVGQVEQTHAVYEERQTLADCLIISHVPVPEAVIREFTESEIPPKGYVLVRWANEQSGRSLVAETDIVVINRSLGLGDNVKKDGSNAMTGVVAGVQEKFILQPIWKPDAQGIAIDLIAESPGAPNSVGTSFSGSPEPGKNSIDIATPHPRLPSEVPHRSPDQLLYEVPSHELIRATDIQTEDHIIYRSWFGVVQEIDTDVVLLLGDGSVVVVDNPLEVEITVPDTTKPLVCAPSPAAPALRPDVPAHFCQGMLLSMMPENLQCGQYVITNSKNLKDGRWIQGSFSPHVIPAGRVLAVPTRSAEVSWLCPNAFSEPRDGMEPPSTAVYPYENIKTFHSTRSLRRNKKVILYDHDNRPRNTYRHDLPIFGQSDFSVGSQVKFRDNVAAERYLGVHSQSSRQETDPSNTCYGFDMQQFVVVSSQQEVTVLWQDGSRTVEYSVNLRPHTLPETELSPGEYVISKEDLFQLRHGLPESAKTRYNEIQYLQGNYQLLPQKVGVVQKVDSRERLAHVRWFESPRVRLNEQGNILSSGSTFGRVLSDLVEEVSIYTIMSQPALDRRRQDMVMICPETPALAAIESIQNEEDAKGSVGSTLLSYFGPSRPDELYEDLRHIAKGILTYWHPSAQSTPQNPRRHVDWLGEIIDLGLDGLITVRLGALPSGRCKDIRVPLERILMVIDSEAEEIDADEYYLDYPFDDSPFEPESPLEELFEYEGGEKIGDGSDEDLWTTDEDVPTHEPPSIGQGADSDVEMIDSDAADTGNSPTKIKVDASQTSDLLLNTTNLSSEPARFLVQATQPPSDHHYLYSNPPTKSKLLRRIQREHKVLSSSLPVGTYVHTFESRLDLLRIMIIGAKDTPYEFAPFVVDLHLGKGFPQSPPHAYFHSWTHGLGRINPNLYEEGKICLSLLGTWPGKSEGESWTEKSTLLQLILSLSALVLVKDPFYNEAGFENLAAEGQFIIESSQYTEKCYVLSRGFIKHALQHPVLGFEDVLVWNYSPVPRSSDPDTITAAAETRPDMLRLAVHRANRLIARTLQPGGNDSNHREPTRVDGEGREGKDAFMALLTKGAMVMVKRHVQELASILEQAQARARNSGAEMALDGV